MLKNMFPTVGDDTLRVTLKMYVDRDIHVTF